MKIPGRILATTLALLTTVGTSFLLLSCTGDSAETAIRQISLLVSGVYRHPSAGSNLVGNNTGQPITQLDLRQTGDQLEGIDNNGAIWKGTIGNADDTQGSFTLDGQNTVGAEATWSGTITKSSDTTADMRGTYIEPTLFSTIAGVAIVPSNAPSGGGGGGGSTNGDDLVISPASVTLTNNGQEVQFSASGGSGSGFTWTLSQAGLGNLSPSTGTPVTYERLSQGDNTIRVTDSGGNSDTADIFQP